VLLDGCGVAAAAKRGGAAHVFEVSSARPYALAAASAEERDAWVDAISSEVGRHAAALEKLAPAAKKSRRTSIMMAKAVADAEAESDDAAPALEGELFYKTKVKSLLGKEKMAWKKFHFALVVDADAGPCLEWAARGSTMRVVLEGCAVCRDDAAAPTGKVYAFHVAHESFAAGPKYFHAASLVIRTRWVDAIADAVADFAAAAAPAKQTAKTARRASLALEAAVVHDEDEP